MKEPAHRIRVATVDDIDDALAIARECYPGREVGNARQWAEWIIKNPDRLALIGKDTVGIAAVYLNYGFERHARIDMLASRKTKAAPLEALEMIRIMMHWAWHHKGLRTTLRLSSDTGVDFKPFAERLGGCAVTPSYDIPLKEDPRVG